MCGEYAGFCPQQLVVDIIIFLAGSGRPGPSLYLRFEILADPTEKNRTTLSAWLRPAVVLEAREEGVVAHTLYGVGNPHFQLC